MKITHRLSSERLLDVLEEWTKKEPYFYPNIYGVLVKSGNEIGHELRDRTVRWLWHLNQDLEFHPETLSLAINILDRFLALVKTRAKYVQCIAIACYYLAIKTMEEDEEIPTLVELVDTSDCGCSSMDIIRMERIILSKLEWNLLGPTSFSFLHLFHGVVFSCLLPKQSRHSSSAQHLHKLIEKLEDCMCNYKFTQFKGSVLAMSLLSLELEKMLPWDWLMTTIRLQQLTQVNQTELIRCRELITQTFDKETVTLQQPTSPVFKNSLATIPESPEEYAEEQMELSESLPDHLAECVLANKKTGDNPVREELKRFQRISAELFSETPPKPKRHKSGHTSEMSCAAQMLCQHPVDANTRQPLQAIN